MQTSGGGERETKNVTKNESVKEHEGNIRRRERGISREKEKRQDKRERYEEINKKRRKLVCRRLPKDRHWEKQVRIHEANSRVYWPGAVMPENHEKNEILDILDIFENLTFLKILDIFENFGHF